MFFSSVLTINQYLKHINSSWIYVIFKKICWQIVCFGPLDFGIKGLLAHMTKGPCDFGTKILETWAFGTKGFFSLLDFGSMVTRDHLTLDHVTKGPWDFRIM